ncbi:MAG: hypothetical protein KJN76_03270 [Eudoraea sp.]|nr:hypothetical protein [Eudoraea sp.]
MKKLSYIMAAVLLLSLSNLHAGEMVKPKPAKSLSYQIKDLIGHDAIEVADKDLKGKILFTLNKDREIVVLAVEADTEQMENFIKSRLNYKKVDVSNWEEGKKYVVPILVTS